MKTKASLKLVTILGFAASTFSYGKSILPYENQVSCPSVRFVEVKLDEPREADPWGQGPAHKTVYRVLRAQSEGNTINPRSFSLYKDDFTPMPSGQFEVKIRSYQVLSEKLIMGATVNGSQQILKRELQVDLDIEAQRPHRQVRVNDADRWVRCHEVIVLPSLRVEE